MTTMILRPNSRVDSLSWNGSYTDVDEAHTEPDGEGDGNEMDTSTHGGYYIFGLPDTMIDIASVTKIKVWALRRATGVGVYLAQCDYRIGDGGDWSDGEGLYILSEAAEAWDYVRWQLLCLSGADIDDLQIRITFTEISGDARFYLDCLYVEITYTIPTITPIFTRRERFITI